MKRDKVYIMQLLAAQPASSFIVSTPGGPPALVAREHVRLPDLASIFAEVGVGSMRANTASMTVNGFGGGFSDEPRCERDAGFALIKNEHGLAGSAAMDTRTSRPPKSTCMPIWRSRSAPWPERRQPRLRPADSAPPTNFSPSWRRSDYAASFTAITASQAGLAALVGIIRSSA